MFKRYLERYQLKNKATKKIVMALGINNFSFYEKTLPTFL